MIRLILGDALSVLPTLPEGSVDMVLTDPPFFLHREVRILRRAGQKFGARTDIVAGGWNWDRQWATEEEYRDWCLRWFRECVRVLREGGHFVCFFNRLRTHWFHEWGKPLGMVTRQPLYWIVENPVPRARKVDFMLAVYEIFWSTKGSYSKKVSTFNHELGQHPNYCFAPLVGGRERLRDTDGTTLHPTQKPERVVEWLIRYLTRRDDLVLDPFAGTGTTPTVCARLGRSCIAIEIEPKFYEAMKSRLSSVQMTM